MSSALEDGKVDEAAFRAAMADLPAAVSIVTTTAADGTPRGATVSAVTSVSMSPAMLLVCLDARSDTLAALDRGRRFLVHVAVDGQQETVMRFAGKGTEKFADVAWTADAASGQPLIAGAGVVFTCVAEILQPAGDHTVVIGRIVGIDHDPSRRPVVYHRRTLLPAPAP
jgi:flavin reductase (DIM6/NTAB) family NADH-FMN oxidoreductase RutF